MKIVGIDGLTPSQIQFEVAQGARFVLFQYCISILVMSFKRPSGIYFIRPGESKAAKILGFSAVSLLLGWWGIPWGPIYTVATVATNLGGGKDVTDQLMASFGQRA